MGRFKRLYCSYGNMCMYGIVYYREVFVMGSLVEEVSLYMQLRH